jgi:hypothetical protein
METILWCLGIGVATVAWAAWRLKGGMTMKEASLAVLGGPRPTTPKKMDGPQPTTPK